MVSSIEVPLACVHTRVADLGTRDDDWSSGEQRGTTFSIVQSIDGSVCTTSACFAKCILQRVGRLKNQLDRGTAPEVGRAPLKLGLRD